MSKHSFTIHIPEAIINDLHERLVRSRWPDEITDAGWEYGTNLAYLKELVEYWQNQFDWRVVQEQKLNGCPSSFCTGVDSQRGKG